MTEESYHATGKRKTAIARVWMRPGSGQIVINKHPMQEYVSTEAQRVTILEPLTLAEAMGKFDITVNVRGGGPMGQAGAIRHGISRALVMVDAEMRGPLKKEGYLTRDPRMKERKKYGQPGARKRFQYSKR